MMKKNPNFDRVIKSLDLCPIPVIRFCSMHIQLSVLDEFRGRHEVNDVAFFSKKSVYISYSLFTNISFTTSWNPHDT